MHVRFQNRRVKRVVVVSYCLLYWKTTYFSRYFFFFSLLSIFLRLTNFDSLSQDIWDLYGSAEYCCNAKCNIKNWKTCKILITDLQFSSQIFLFQELIIWIVNRQISSTYFYVFLFILPHMHFFKYDWLKATALKPCMFHIWLAGWTYFNTWLGSVLRPFIKTRLCWGKVWKVSTDEIGDKRLK